MTESLRDTHVPLGPVVGTAPLQSVTLIPVERQSRFYRIQVTFFGEGVAVTGDAYDWVFRWPGCENIAAEVRRFDEHYILGKMTAQSTQAQPELYDAKGTIDSLREWIGGEENWPEVEAAAKDAGTVHDAIDLLSRTIREPVDIYDQIVTRRNPVLGVVFQAIQMAADHIYQERIATEPLSQEAP